MLLGGQYSRRKHCVPIIRDIKISSPSYLLVNVAFVLTVCLSNFHVRFEPCIFSCLKWLIRASAFLHRLEGGQFPPHSYCDLRQLLWLISITKHLFQFLQRINPSVGISCYLLDRYFIIFCHWLSFFHCTELPRAATWRQLEWASRGLHFVGEVFRLQLFEHP